MTLACDRVQDLASGYVLGALDAADMAAVREHLSTCPNSHPELREMGGVLPYLGGSLAPVEPPRHLRAAVLSAVQAEMSARSAEHAPVPVAARPRRPAYSNGRWGAGASWRISQAKYPLSSYRALSEVILRTG